MVDSIVREASSDWCWELIEWTRTDLIESVHGSSTVPGFLADSKCAGLQLLFAVSVHLTSKLTLIPQVKAFTSNCTSTSIESLITWVWSHCFSAHVLHLKAFLFT